MSLTLDYYNRHADEFVIKTYDLDFSDVQDQFLSYLKPGDKVLDLGCGSGRDSVYFLSKGMNVDSIDGSRAICREAKKVSGINVKCLEFDELNFNEEYDAIWACASLLHLKTLELSQTLKRVVKALKPGGYLYASFKYGSFSGIRDGRYFNDMTEPKFTQLISFFPNLKVINLWITSDIRKERETTWLNTILQKV